MSISPEERQKLRQKREFLRRQKAKKRRRRLLLILGAILLCGGLVFLLISLLKPDKNPATDPSTPPVPNTVIHYAAVGDLNINAATVGDGFDYGKAFMDVAHLLADADISSVNFEGNFAGAPYGDSGSAPTALAEAMANMGIDLVQLANSYSINRGLSGLTASIDTVYGAGMTPLGVYRTNSEFQSQKGFTIREVGGIRMAFVAFTKGMDGMALPAGSEECVNVLYEDYDSVYQKVNRQKITRILSDVKKENPDIVIALLHWGSEYNDTISKTQESIVNLMQENGVDAIIGTHSHYVQKMTLDKETGQFVAYSLGDFYSDGARAGSEYSVVLDLEITKDGLTGETKITDFTYTPIFSVREEGKPLQVMRIEPAVDAYKNNYLERVSAQTYERMCYALKRIESRIKG